MDFVISSKFSIVNFLDLEVMIMEKDNSQNHGDCYVATGGGLYHNSQEARELIAGVLY